MNKEKKRIKEFCNELLKKEIYNLKKQNLINRTQEIQIKTIINKIFKEVK